MSILEHHFPPLIAEKYGVNAAIFLRDIYHWCETNKNNEEHFHDGRWWTYQTIAGLCKRHTYWTKNQVEHIIRTCKEKGALLSGHFSENQFDRTCWYALTDEALALFDGPTSMSEKSEMESQEIPELGRKNQKCYKDKNNKTENITNNPLPPEKPSDEVAAVFDDYAGEDADLRQRLTDFQESRRKKKKPLHTQRAARILVGKLENLSGGDRAAKLALLDNAILHGWDSVYPLKDDERPNAHPGAPSKPLRGEGVRYL
ncbi:MAG: hypothetical protein K2N78_03210 [Oscillospiraceae bacterium]|nr:hypothetical protein [Oscillospiraceae bacterium]